MHAQSFEPFGMTEQLAESDCLLAVWRLPRGSRHEGCEQVDSPSLMCRGLPALLLKLSLLHYPSLSLAASPVHVDKGEIYDASFSSNTVSNDPRWRRIAHPRCGIARSGHNCQSSGIRAPEERQGGGKGKRGYSYYPGAAHDR